MYLIKNTKKNELTTKEIVLHYRCPLAPTAWDKNLIANRCLIGADNQAKLLGAEVRYPPIGLGIEDVNRWEWMSNNYKSWLASPGFKKNPICE